jgi:hypothetical protein
MEICLLLCNIGVNSQPVCPESVTDGLRSRLPAKVVVAPPFFTAAGENIMDLNKAQGRQVVTTNPESREIREPVVSSVIRGDPRDILEFQDTPEQTQALYDRLNKTIRCTLFEQHRAYLRCPVCSEYDTCVQLRTEQRIELQNSPFFSIKEITWDGPRRTKKMYIAVCTDGSLRRLDNFDPKDTDGVGIDQYKDVEEVLVVTKAFRRKVMWAPVPLEQLNAGRDNGGAPENSESLIKKETIAEVTRQRKARNGAAKPNNGKKK